MSSLAHDDAHSLEIDSSIGRDATEQEPEHQPSGGQSGFGTTPAKPKSDARRIAVAVWQIGALIFTTQNLLFMGRALIGQAEQAYNDTVTQYPNGTIPPSAILANELLTARLPAFFSVLFNVMLSRSAVFENLIKESMPMPESKLAKAVKILSFALTLIPGALTFGILSARPMGDHCLPVLDERTQGFSSLFSDAIFWNDLLFPEGMLGNILFIWNLFPCLVLVTSPYYETIYAHVMSLLLSCNPNLVTPQDRADIATLLEAEKFSKIPYLTRQAHSQRAVKSWETIREEGTLNDENGNQHNLARLTKEDIDDLIHKTMLYGMIDKNSELQPTPLIPVETEQPNDLVGDALGKWEREQQLKREQNAKNAIKDAVLPRMVAENRRLKDAATNITGTMTFTLLLRTILATGFIAVSELVKKTFTTGYLALGALPGNLVSLYVNFATLMTMHLFAEGAIMSYTNLVFAMFALCLPNWRSKGQQQILKSEAIKAIFIIIAYLTVGPAVANAKYTALITLAPFLIGKLMEIIAMANTMIFNSLGFPKNSEDLANYVRDKAKWLKKNVACGTSENNHSVADADALDEGLLDEEAPTEAEAPELAETYVPRADHYSDQPRKWAKMREASRIHNTTIQANAVRVATWFTGLAIFVPLAVMKITATGSVFRNETDFEIVTEQECFDGLKNVTTTGTTFTCNGGECPTDPSYVTYHGWFSSIMLLFTAAYFLVKKAYTDVIEAGIDRDWGSIFGTLLGSTALFLLPALIINQIVAAVSTAAQYGDAPLEGIEGIFDNMTYGGYMMTTLMTHFTVDYFAGCSRTRTRARSEANFGGGNGFVTGISAITAAVPHGHSNPTGSELDAQRSGLN
jgi:hypothetical protein